MTFAPKSAGVDAPAAAVRGPGRDSRPPEGKPAPRRWSKRQTLNLVIGVTGAAWALVAVVLKLVM